MEVIGSEGNDGEDEFYDNEDLPQHEESKHSSGDKQELSNS
jgi:hypothetical protein